MALSCQGHACIFRDKSSYPSKLVQKDIIGCVDGCQHEGQMKVNGMVEGRYGQVGKKHHDGPQYDRHTYKVNGNVPRQRIKALSSARTYKKGGQPMSGTQPLHFIVVILSIKHQLAFKVSETHCLQRTGTHTHSRQLKDKEVCHWSVGLRTPTFCLFLSKEARL